MPQGSKSDPSLPLNEPGPPPDDKLLVRYIPDEIFVLSVPAEAAVQRYLKFVAKLMIVYLWLSYAL